MNDTNTIAVAQVTAAAIASATATLKADATIAAAGLSSGQIVKKAVEQVKDNVLPTVLQNGKATVTDASSQEKVVAQVSATVTNVVKGKIENIVSSTKSGDGTVIDMANVFKTTGLIIANSDTGDYLDSSGKRVNGNWNGYVDALQVQWVKFDIATATNKGPDTERVLVGKSWFKKYEDGEDFAFDGSAWVRSGNGYEGKPSISGNCVDAPMTLSGTLSQVFCATAKNLSGKAMGELIPNLCNTEDSPNCDPKALFPEGSIAYDFTVSAKQDIYRLYVSSTWSGYYTEGSNDIYGFLAALKKYPQWVGGGCAAGILVANYDTTVNPKPKTGTIKWAANTSPNGCNNATAGAYTETTNFEIVTVGGKELIKLETSNLYRSRTGNTGSYRVFGFMQGSSQKGIYSGDFMPANFRQSFQFTGNVSTGPQFVSPILLDAMLKQKNLTPYPYPSN